MAQTFRLSDIECAPKGHWQTDTRYMFICKALYVSEGAGRQRINVNQQTLMGSLCWDRLARMTQSTPLTAEEPIFESGLRSDIGEAMMQTGASLPKQRSYSGWDRETCRYARYVVWAQNLWLETCNKKRIQDSLENDCWWFTSAYVPVCGKACRSDARVCVRECLNVCEPGIAH